MKRIAYIVLVLCAASCKKTPMEVTSTETRVMTTKDGEVKLFASSQEQFRGSVTSPFLDQAPQHWLARPASQFRLLNYAFGKSGKGEVYVSVSQGSVMDNVNRWRKQFSQSELTAQELAALPTSTMLGAEAVIVEAEGLYAGGMGKEAAEGFGLAGLVARVGDDIVTIKMVGPKDEVAAEKDHLLSYAKTLQSRE